MKASFSRIWFALLLLIWGLYTHAKPMLGLCLAASISLIMLAKWLRWKAGCQPPVTSIAEQSSHTARTKSKWRWLQYTTLATGIGLWLWLLCWQLQHAWPKEAPLAYHSLLAAVVLIAYLIPWVDQATKEGASSTPEDPSQAPDASSMLNLTLFDWRPLTRAAVARMLRNLAVFILPVFLFDGCLNRDPNFYLDKHTNLFAPWPGAPMTMKYRNREFSKTFQVRDVSDLLISGSVFIGKTTGPEPYFVVSGRYGHLQTYVTKEERDRALERDYSLRPANMHDLLWYARMRANHLYPYNLLYYLLVTLAIVLPTLFTRRKPAHLASPVVALS